MKRLQSWFHNYFTAPFVTFLAGLFGSIIITAIFETVIPVSGGIVALSLILLVVFSVSIMAKLRHDMISALMSSRLVAKVHHATQIPDGDASLYDPVIDKISTANESIRVVSLTRSPDLSITSSRRKYYDALNELLERKHRNKEDFRYERILQVKQVRTGELHCDQTDELTYEHCRYLRDFQLKGTTLKINLRQIPDVLGSLSFLIVDDKEIIFAIPTITRDSTQELKALQLGTSMFFTDPDRVMVRELLNLFDDLLLNGDTITTLIE